MPSFDLSDSGGIGLVVLRGLCDVALLAVFGTVTLRALAVPAGLAGLPDAPRWRRRMRGLNQTLCAAALVLLALWLIFTSRALADASDWGDTASAIATVMTDTHFGTVVIAQAAALGLCLVALWLANRFGDALACLGAVVAVVLQACHGHAFSMGSAGLFAVTALHLLAAGAWLGALPALGWLIGRLPPSACGRLASAFSPIGQVAVLLLAVTALLQGMVMIPSWQTLFTTAYGWTAMLKALLFLALLALAAANRLVWTARLTRGQDVRPGFAMTIGMEVLAGLAVILAAGLLASLPPVMRM